MKWRLYVIVLAAVALFVTGCMGGGSTGTTVTQERAAIEQRLSELFNVLADDDGALADPGPDDLMPILSFLTDPFTLRFVTTEVVQEIYPEDLGFSEFVERRYDHQWMEDFFASVNDPDSTFADENMDSSDGRLIEGFLYFLYVDHDVILDGLLADWTADDLTIAEGFPRKLGPTTTVSGNNATTSIEFRIEGQDESGEEAIAASESFLMQFHWVKMGGTWYVTKYELTLNTTIKIPVRSVLL